MKLLCVVMFGLTVFVVSNGKADVSAQPTPWDTPVIPPASECAGRTQDYPEQFATIGTLLQTATSVPTATTPAEFRFSTPDATFVAVRDAEIARLREQLESGTYSIQPEHEPVLALVRLYIACTNASDLAAAGMLIAPESLLQSFPSRHPAEFVDRWSHLEDLSAQLRIMGYPGRTEILTVLTVIGPLHDAVTVFQVERLVGAGPPEPAEVIRYLLRTDGNRWMIVEGGVLCEFDPVTICAIGDMEVP